MTTAATLSPEDFRRTETRTGGVAQVGDIVSYTDMANPTEFFLVIGTGFTQMPNVGPEGLYWTNGSAEFTLQSLHNGRKHTSDLRQYGWVKAETR